MISTETKLDIEGHRGARGLVPENSIPAFLKAIELGVSTIEMDVCISKDNLVAVSYTHLRAHETM
jgi:glycerophosphoryl diester phosphodiesterase